MHILKAPQNLAFVIALALVMALARLQLLSLLAGGTGFDFGNDAGDGFGLQHAMTDGFDTERADGALDQDGADIAGGPDGLFFQALSWLHVGQIPSTTLRRCVG